MKPGNPSPASVRRLLLALSAVGVLLLGTGCDEDGQGGGIGASTSLPAVITNFGGENVDIGVGNVQWVGNPRW